MFQELLKIDFVSFCLIGKFIFRVNFNSSEKRTKRGTFGYDFRSKKINISGKI